MHDVLTLTEALVAEDTVSHRSTAPCVALLAPILEEAGFGVTVQEVRRGEVIQQNLVARRGSGSGGLFLGGHLDTVPWQPGTRGTTRPERDGPLLFGRGTCDMKGGVAAVVEACRRVASIPLRRPLVLGFTFEEEVGCHGAGFLMEELPHGCEVGIVAEPTDLAPAHMHKGYLGIDLDLVGVPAHASDPSRGVSAAWGAAALLERLRRLAEELRVAPLEPRLSPPWTTLNVGRVDVGSARNIVAPGGTIQLELRPLPGQPAGELVERVRALAREAEREVPGLVIRLRPPRLAPALQTSAESELVGWLAEETGQAPRGVPFYTEGPIFAGRGAGHEAGSGAAVVVCGPGSISQAHTRDEHVEIDALEVAADLYRRAILRFAG